MVYHWNPDKSLLKRYLTLLVHTLTDPLPTPLSIAVEEDQGLEVINTADMQDSPHQY